MILYKRLSFRQLVASFLNTFMDEPVPVQPSPFADRGLIGTFPPPYQSQAPSTSIIQNQLQPSKSPQFWDSGIMVVFSAVQASKFL